MNDTTGPQRSWSMSDVAWLMIAFATIIQIARICGVTAVHGELPSLSANDRSRWSAVAALLEDGTWEIDRVNELLDSKGKSRIWASIDIVRHRGRDGKEHFYSSKPPLLTLLYAAVTKPVTMITGKKVTEEPFLIMRSVMVLVNVVPIFVFWVWWHRWLERNVSDEWSRFMLLNFALWGTFLTTFTVTLNNHIHGALFFVVSLALLWQIGRAAQQDRDASWWVWIACGLSAGLTVACELPALAWAVAAGAILLVANWKKFLFGYGVGTAIIAVAFLATTIWAHGDWRPPYSHRGVGSAIGTIPNSADAKEPALATVIDLANKNGYKLTDQTKITPARLTDVLQVIDESIGQRVAAKRNANGDWGICHWDDWYDYPKSYWLPGNKKGVDLGEANPWMYVVHFLVGHHGIYSVTPIWLLTFVGAWAWIQRQRSSSHHLVGLRQFVLSDRGMAIAFLSISAACIVFYSTRVVEDRNYGGVSSGFRWMFWLIPAWLWLCVPAVEMASQSKNTRWIVSLLLILSIFGATIPWTNPWTHPWPYRVSTWLFPEKVEVKP
ncbi:MAG: hypothetical protein ABL921_30825 [Pirellula sp.]